MNKTFSAPQDSDVIEYVHRTFQPEDNTLADIRNRSKEAGLPPIQLGAMDGRHLEILTRASGAKVAVEIGTLGGYSGTCIARGLPAGGRLFTFELEAEFARVASESFRRADVGHLVEVMVGPALENLHKIDSHGPFDLVFIDADKVNYPKYFQWAAKHLRVGGLLIGDNTLGFGKIAKAISCDDPDYESVEGLRVFNEMVSKSSQFRATLFPTGEGLTVAVKVR